MPPYSTPEDAARGDIPARYVRVVGVVVRGDAAVVAQLMNDGPPYEVETAYAYREGVGWTEGSSGNSTSGYLPTGDGLGTIVVWDIAPAGATAARFAYADRGQVVAVANGCAVGVFDDVPQRDALSFFEGPRLAAWISADGSETQMPTYDGPEWTDARRFFLEGRTE